MSEVEPQSYAAFATRLADGGILSDPWVEGRPRFRVEPLLLSPALQAALYRAAEEVAAAYDEACGLCLAEPALLDFLGLTPVQRLLWEASAPLWHGIARADVFLTPTGPAICEINSDTPSGEPEAVLLNAAVAPDSPGLLDPNAQLGERFCRVIEAFAAGVSRERGPLSVGILYPTDLTEDLSMILLYRRWFEERGWRVTLGSPFNLRPFPGGRAGLFDTPVQVFVRHYKTDWWGERLPVWDNDEEFADPDPLERPLGIVLRALLEGRAAVVNPFGAVVPQNKRAMALMWEEIARFSPGAQEAIRRYVPRTVRLETLSREELIREKDGWVLKSDYGCEGEEVVVGRDASPETWEAALLHAVPGRWVAQRRFEALRDEDGGTANYGVFLCGGQAAGLYTRVSSAATDHLAVTVPTLVRAP